MAAGVLGLASIGGRYSSPCSSKLKGESNATQLTSGIHFRPVCDSSSSNSPSERSVAEVRMAPAARRHSVAARLAAALTGEAENR